VKSSGLLDRIEDESGPVMADRTLAIVRRILNWHASRSDDFRSPIVRGMARTKPKARARERTLTDDELRIIWAAASSGPFGYFIRFLLLTATRRGEPANARRSELAGSDWIIPGKRYKTGTDHLVPLSGAAQTLLTKLHSKGFLFSTDGGETPISGFSKFKRGFDKTVGPLPNWTLHDLRRTARSLMSRAEVSGDVAERCLDHAVGGVRGTYDRHEYYEEKRKAFEALASLIAQIVDPQENVVAIRGQR
jgi:integrase